MIKKMMSASDKIIHNIYGIIDNCQSLGAIYTCICMALVLILTGESLVIRTQLHLLIMLRKHLDNHLNPITEEGRRERRERERKLTLIKNTSFGGKLTYA